MNICDLNLSKSSINHKQTGSEQPLQQEDLLDLITALVKYNCLPTLIAQCIYESNGS